MEEEGNGSNEPENDLKDPLVLEYEPLTELNTSLPRHYGLMRESVFYTCLDASSRYLALGSTKGLVVVYDLYSWFFRTFKESKHSVTVVKINPCVQGLAYGCSNGDTVTVLFSNIREAETNVKRYIVHEASNTTVSALEWDDSGERLFVGYTDGKLVQVDFQYEKGTCSASTLLNGGWNICQLSCSHGDLLISSLTCSLMMELSTGRLKQIGQSQRKTGPYGGCFGLHDIDPNQAFIARPGFRIWCTDNKGEVLSTIKLKSAVVSSLGPPIMLLNEDIDFPPPPEDIHFSLLYPWHSRYLVTFNKTYLWVLDPANVRIIGTHCHAHDVLSVCPCNDHIYMLSYGEREKATVRKLSIRTDLQKFIHRAVLPTEDLLPQESPKAVIPSSTVSQAGMSTSKSDKKSVLPTSKSDEGTDSPTTKSGKETRSPATKSAREANKEKDVTSSGKLSSSVDIRPLALLEKESQMKRLADFNVDQDFDTVVKQVKKKKKKPAVQSSTSPQSPHRPPARSSAPSTPLSPVVKEYPKIEAIVKGDASILQPTKSSPPEAENTIVEERDESKEQYVKKPKSKVSSENSQLETHKEVEFTPSVVAPCDVKSEEKTSRTGTNTRGEDEASSTLKGASTSESGVTNVQTHSQPAVVGDTGIVDISPAPVTELDTEVTHQNLPEMNSREDHKPSEPLEILSHSTTAEDIVEETDNPTDVVGGEDVQTLPAGVETVHDDDGHSDDDVIDQVSVSEDRWIPITPPPTRHQVTALYASSDHLWAVDSKGGIWHRALIALPNELSPEWTTDLSVTLQDLAVSREGDLLWGISSKGILVKTLVPQKGKMVVKSWQALEMKQKKVTATSVGFGVNGAWVLCEKGQLLYRSNVSGSNPKGKVWNEVAGSSDIVKLSCWGQAVWALTKDHQLLVRTGFSNGPIGTDWESVTAPCPVCHVSVAEEVVWIVGEQGQVFFRKGISKHTPCGCGPWWEVVVKNSDPSAEHHGLQGLLKFKSMFTSEDPCSVATDGKSGVWILYNTGLILACLSSLSGSHYGYVTNDDLFNISTWKEVALGGVVGKRGVAWLVRDDGVLFACDMQGEVVKMDLQSPVFAAAGSKHASWVATEDALFSREGFDKRHPLGTMWHNVDLTQLKDRLIQSISLGSNCSWAVDDRGEPWFRFDVFAQDKESGFAQVWIPVQREGLPHPLTKIAMGPSPSYVWAIDTKLSIYVRKGSTADYPIGKGWVLVEGAKGKDVCVSAHHVWVLTPEGQILCRDGVQPAKIEGRTWKPIPGQFTRISCSQDGQIWGITADNNVLKRSTSVIKYKSGPTSTTQSKDSFTETFIGGSSGDIDPDWEMI